MKYEYEYMTLYFAPTPTFAFTKFKPNKVGVGFLFLVIIILWVLHTTRDRNRPGQPIGTYDLTYDMLGQTFFLNREDLGFFKSLFSLIGQATGHSKSLLGLFGRPI